VDLNAKMSKSKKKKLKKREKRNQQLMEEAMKHALEVKVSTVLIFMKANNFACTDQNIFV
jgi:hypothetical protein